MNYDPNKPYFQGGPSLNFNQRAYERQTADRAEHQLLHKTKALDLINQRRMKVFE